MTSEKPDQSFRKFIEITCPNCGRMGKVVDKGTAVRLRCSKCSESFTAGTAAPDRSEAAAIDDDQAGIHPLVYVSLAIAAGVVLLLFSVVWYGDRTESTGTRIATAETPRDESSAEPKAIATLSPSELYKLTSPSVFAVECLNEEGEVIWAGSGFVVSLPSTSWSEEMKRNRQQVQSFLRDSDTKIEFAFGVTNHHVIDHAVDCRVKLQNGETATVTKIVSENEAADIALLEMLVNKVTIPTPLKLATAIVVDVGETAYAIGNPLGLENSLSQGLVSGHRRISTELSMLQTTTAISPGSSGGPLLNSKGEVIGVMTSFVPGGQGVNFAIPAVAVARCLEPPLEPRYVWEGRSVDQLIYTLLINHVSAALKSEQFEWAKAYYKGLVAYQSEQWDEVVQTLEPLISALPDERRIFAHYLLASAYLEKFLATRSSQTDDQHVTLEYYGKSFDNANRCLLLDDGFVPAEYLIYTYYLLAGENQDALRQADKLVQKLPKCAKMHLSKGLAASLLGEEDVAFASYRSALDVDPLNSQALFGCGQIYARRGNMREAIEALSSAVETEAFDTAFGHGTLGHTLELAGQFDEAIKAYARARDKGLDLKAYSEAIERCRGRQ